MNKTLTITTTLQPSSARHKGGSSSRDDVGNPFLFHLVHSQQTDSTDTEPIVEFVDETKKVIYEAATADSGLDDMEPDLESPVLSDQSQSLLREFSQSFISETPNGQDNPQRFLSREQTLPESPRLSEIASEALSLRGSVQPPETVSSSVGHARRRSPTDRFIARSGSFQELYYTTRSTFPIEDPVEAELYRHYVQSLAPWVSNTDTRSMHVTLTFGHLARLM